MAGVGGSFGDFTKNHPDIFVCVVAFGVVALLALVCNELLIEAAHAQGEESKWWISIFTFVGIYFVIFLDRIVKAVGN